MTDAIRIRSLCKRFGPKVAVDGVDLSVPEGAIAGFIGPNGAGKTTTIRMVMSIIFPDSGELEVLGRRSAVESKDRIGYLPEERGVYRKMKVGAFLTHMARLKGVDNAGLSKRITDWLERVELGDCYRKKCEELSKGMQQKVQFIASVIHDPELLILDEPFSGLDPVNMRLLRDLIMEQHERGCTIIFSTHVMQQAESLCNRIFMIHQGRKVLDATLDEIRDQFDPHTLVLEPLERDVTPESIQDLDFVEHVMVSGTDFEIRVADGVDPASGIRNLVDRVPVRRIEVRRPTLEDVFIDIVQSDDSETELRSALRAGGAS